MLRRLTTVFALLLQLGTAAPAAATGDLDPRAYRVTRPGEVLFDRGARAALLAGLTPEQRQAWCGPATESWRSHKAKTGLKTPAAADLQTDERSEPFAWTIMKAAAAAFGQGDPDAREALTGNLRRWARGKALTKLKDRHENTYYSLERTLLPTIVAYGLVRSDPDWDRVERKEVERWLNRLVRLRGIKRPEETRGPVSRMNNHRYLSDSVDMAWGALRGDDALFRQGIESFLLALAQMRPDGSLPLETRRGSKALWYQRQAVSSLVAIAEMAAVQGYDLYAMTIEDRSLHRAVEFLARGIAEPELVMPYARANKNPGEFANYLVQDRSFMRRRGHDRHYMAWFEAYRARFPEREATRLLARLLSEYEAQSRPLVDDFSGGNMTCFFARGDGAPGEGS
ncbi:MAG TPA: alginate lyase family protein [Geminicoccaceae bacterium]|nr:alginate lyase family protein [Geminicoccaceae bacterium]